MCVVVVVVVIVVEGSSHRGCDEATTNAPGDVGGSQRCDCVDIINRSDSP